MYNAGICFCRFEELIYLHFSDISKTSQCPMQKAQCEKVDR